MSLLKDLRVPNRLHHWRHFLQAAGGIVDLSQNTSSAASKFIPLFSFTDLPSFLNALFKTAIVVGAILAVLRLSYAGFIYMTTDIWTHKENAKTIIQQTVLGLLLLLSIWIILYQINPDLLNLDAFRCPREGKC